MGLGFRARRSIFEMLQGPLQAAVLGTTSKMRHVINNPFGIL